MPTEVKALAASSIMDDPEYQSNYTSWLARQASLRAEHGHNYKVEMSVHPQVQKVMDALANKNFEAMRKSAKIIGLRLLTPQVNGLMKPEFNLLEQAAVYDAEPLVRKAITRQLNLWFKQGFTFTGDDPKLVDYIRKRFKTIAFVTGIPTVDLLKTVVRSLLKYSNAFLVKVRDPKFSSGIVHDGVQPVAGYFPVSPLSMFPYFQKGRLVEWQRFLRDGPLQRYPVSDVIHLTLDREEDFIFGKPRMLGTIEDVAALRRIEENVEVQIAKFLFPVYHLMVGTPEAPCRFYNDGTSEIDAAYALVQNIEAEGMLITSERFGLEVVGAQAEALKADPYLTHFKGRVYAGLGVSAVDMGEGDSANRATADNISQNLKDLVIEDQVYFAAQVQQAIFAELFLEHPDKISALNAYDQVQLHFANVDMDNLIKAETHATNLWNNDGITDDEFRRRLGLEPFTPEDKLKTHFHQIEMPLSIISARDEPYTAAAKRALAGGVKTNAPQPAAPGTGSSGQARQGGTGRIRTKRPGTPASRGPATANQPENQHGKNLGPTKRKSSVENEILGRRLAGLLDKLMVVRTAEEAVEVSIRSGFSPEECRVILPTVERATADSQKMAELRSRLVAEFMGIAHMFPDAEE